MGDIFGGSGSSQAIQIAAEPEQLTPDASELARRRAAVQRRRRAVSALRVDSPDAPDTGTGLRIGGT